jgi:hypothetical protein
VDHRLKKKEKTRSDAVNRKKIANTITKRQWSEKSDDYVNDCAVFSCDIVRKKKKFNNSRLLGQDIGGKKTCVSVVS